MRNCYNTGKIQGDIAVGLTYGVSGTAKNSCNFGEINGKKNAVGLVAKTATGGGDDGVKISRCLNKGNVISVEGIAYGIADNSSTTLTEPWGAISTGKIQGKTAVYGTRNGKSYSGENAEAYYLIGQLYLENTKQTDTKEAKTQNELDDIMKETPTPLDILNYKVLEDDKYISKGNAFKVDANNINNGYPILKWQ